MVSGIVWHYPFHPSKSASKESYLRDMLLVWLKVTYGNPPNYSRYYSDFPQLLLRADILRSKVDLQVQSNLVSARQVSRQMT